MVAVEYGVEALAKSCQNANLREASYSHEDAEEEEDGRHVNTREQVAHTLLGSLVVVSAVQVAVEHLSSSPQNAKYEQYAYERRQMGDALEDRHKHQSAYTDNEYSLALSVGEVAYRIVASSLCLWHVQFALKMILQDECRYNHRDERRNDNLHDNSGCRNQALVPKHDSGDIADW